MNDQHELIKQLALLETEQVNQNTIDIDHLSPVEIVSKINEEDKQVALVVEKAKNEIAKAGEIFAEILRNRGRVFYIGAGTSGRLGVLDAAECPPTFGTEPSQIVGIISGGHETLVLSREGVEDRTSEAVKDLKKQNLKKTDFVIGIAASIRTPYTLAGLEYALSVGCKTAFVFCNKLKINNDLLSRIDVIISLPVGPEVITGSTRMKSATAQKMTLNMISTTAMILLGKTYGNLMVDLQARSEKLAARSRKMLIDLFNISLEEANELLDRSGGSVKIAIVMRKFKCDRADAERKLNVANGFISRVT